MDYSPLIVNHPDRAKRIIALEVDGRRVWVKRAFKHYNNRLQVVIGEFIRKVLLGNRSEADFLAAEVRAMEAVRARGALVPQLLQVEREFIVMSDIGPALQVVMREADAEGQRKLAVQAAQAIAKLHLAGGWHGCPVFRNLTVSDAGIGMIDFESHLVNRLPLKVRQGIDVFRMCQSLQKFPERGVLKQVVIGAYRQAKLTTPA